MGNVLSGPWGTAQSLIGGGLAGLLGAFIGWYLWGTDQGVCKAVTSAELSGHVERFNMHNCGFGYFTQPEFALVVATIVGGIVLAGGIIKQVLAKS